MLDEWTKGFKVNHALSSSIIFYWTLFEAGTTGRSALSSFQNFRCLKEKERQSCFKKKKETLKENTVNVTYLCILSCMCVNEHVYSSLLLCFPVDFSRRNADEGWSAETCQRNGTAPCCATRIGCRDRNSVLSETLQGGTREGLPTHHSVHLYGWRFPYRL